MNALSCRFLAVYYNLRFIGDYISGTVYIGHDLEDTDEVCGDAFLIRCTRCGEVFHSETRVDHFEELA